MMHKNDRYIGINRRMERMALKIVGFIIVAMINFYYAASKYF